MRRMGAIAGKSRPWTAGSGLLRFTFKLWQVHFGGLQANGARES